MKAKQCVACVERPSISVDERGIPPLCRSCWDRAGQRIRPGGRVVCTADESCGGVVDRFEDDGTLAVVVNAKGEAWIPVVELVRVIA